MHDRRIFDSNFSQIKTLKQKLKENEENKQNMETRKNLHQTELGK